MAYTENGTTYGCSDALEDRARGVAYAGRQLERVIKDGNTLPSEFTIEGTVYDVVQITGLATNGTSDSQSALSSAMNTSRGGTPTLLVLPPSNEYYRYSDELTLSSDTYLVGYGAKIMPLSYENTRINMSGSTGIFGVALHAVPDAISKWPERFEFNNTTEAGKDGTVANSTIGSWEHCWVQMSGSSDYIMMDVETTGAIAGALRAAGITNALIENCSAMRTHSDSFHIVKNSSFCTVRGLRIYDSGDDGISFIQYTDALGQPRNMLVEHCFMKGGRARGFTGVSAKDILWRYCTVEDATLSGYLFGAKTAHSIDNCSGIIVRDCIARRCGRKQANDPNSGPFATLFATGSYSCTDIEFEDCQGYAYGSDWYQSTFARTTDSGAGISYTTSNCGVTILDRTD